MDDNIHNRLTQVDNASFRGVFEASDVAMYYFNSQKRTDEPLIASKQTIFLMPISLFFTENSYFKRVFNEKLQLLASNGILDYWINKYKKGLYEKFAVDKEPRVLEFDELAGIFYICIGLYSIAFFVLVFEIIVYNLSSAAW